MTNIASTWPFKHSYKTTIILHILPRRHLDYLKWVFDVDMLLHHKLPNMHLEKSNFPTRSSIWIWQKSIWTDTQRLTAQISTLFVSWWFTENHKIHIEISLPAGFWGVAKMHHNLHLVQNSLNKAFHKTLIKPC